MKAIVIGATGATGRDLVRLLLEDQDIEEVRVFARRELGYTHPKLSVRLVDFEAIDSWADAIEGDILFSTLGTTLKQAGSQQKQWRIDYDYQYEVARAARGNGVQTLVLVSSVNANARSKIFYPRMKGALEEAVRALSFARTIIMRPPSLIRKDSDRLGERIAVRLLIWFNRMGWMKSMAPITTEELAQRMIMAAKDAVAGLRILYFNKQ